MTRAEGMLGRQVVYTSRGSADGVFEPVERTATITAVPEYTSEQLNDGSVVSLVVFNPTGLFFQLEVPYSPLPVPGHWSWPAFKRQALQEVAA